MAGRAKVREIIKDKMIQLGHDKWVRSDVIIAIEPITSRFFNTDSNGNKLRSRVLINHAEDEILASRTADTILKSMTRQESDLNQFGKAMKELREEFPDEIVLDKDNEISEKQMVLRALNESPTIKWAIERLPFGKNKFYKLIKQYNIDPKLNLKAANNQDDGLA